jgi:HD-like signal output (HDOD) protein
MSLINVTDVQQGMVLAEDLRAPIGRLLLIKGTILTPKHIRIANVWGVTELNIRGINQDQIHAEATRGMSPEIFEKSIEIEKERFQLVDLKQDVMKELFRLCVLETARKLSGDSEYQEDPFDSSPKNISLNDSEMESPVSLNHLVKEQVKLASLPAVYHQIMEVINNQLSTAFHIAETVSLDTSLSARILRLVNSAFYGMPKRIDSISKAIIWIGSKELTTLAQGVSIISHFKNIPARLFNMNSFWEHSIATGVMARIFSSLKPGLSEERFFAAGLLHDIGILILSNAAPHRMAKALDIAKRRPVPLHIAEEEVFGFDHTQVGSSLLREWKIPTSLGGMIRHLNNPEKASNSLEASLLHVAEVVASASGYHFSNSCYVPQINQAAWEILDFSPSVLSTTLRQSVRQVKETKAAVID